jgi:hypothetical protein
MLQSFLKTHLGRAALGSALGLIVLATCAPGSARAEDDADENFISRFERRVWGGIVRGLGFRSADDPTIEYRERSPLVVPPSRDLPAPQANTVRRNPAWPVDPDAKRAKDRADAKRRVAAGNPNYEVDRGGTNLTPAELNPQVPQTTGSTTAAGAPVNEPSGKPILPSQLGYTGGLFSWMGFGFGRQREEVGTFTAEPPRTDLTAPPQGYQTPSPAQPYGVSPRREPTVVKPADPAVGNL